MPTVREDWKSEPPTNIVCEDCGSVLVKKIAVWTGDGWELYWECDNDCGSLMKDIDWPFGYDELADADDLSALGFTIV